MAKSKITLDRAGMRELLKSPGVRAALHDEVAPILSEAQRGAARHRDTGAYAGAFYVEDDTTDRAVVRVGNRDSKALFLEAYYGILAKAVGGRRRALARERARVRRAERKYEREVAAEEGRDF